MVLGVFTHLDSMGGNRRIVLCNSNCCHYSLCFRGLYCMGIQYMKNYKRKTAFIVEANDKFVVYAEGAFSLNEDIESATKFYEISESEKIKNSLVKYDKFRIFDTAFGEYTYIVKSTVAIARCI